MRARAGIRDGQFTSSSAYCRAGVLRELRVGGRLPSTANTGLLEVRRFDRMKALTDFEFAGQAGLIQW